MKRAVRHAIRVSQAGSLLLVETARKTGLDQPISAALAPWQKPWAVHDPGKILVDLALAVALGGDCLADIAMLRAEPAVFGPVASDPEVSRLIDSLTTAGKEALTTIRTARSEVRQRVWTLASNRAPNTGGQVIVDLDGVLVLSHSDKQDAAPTWKKSYGHHPLMGFVDHGPGWTSESVAALLRPGNAGSNTAADHIEATASPWPNCCPRSTGAGGRLSSAATPRAAPTSLWPGSPGADAGCPTPSAW